MQRWITGVLTGVILVCSGATAPAFSLGCPKNDAARVIVSKDPYCSRHHLKGDQCQARWAAYWGMTAQRNEFLEQCRMRHWPEHKS
jgi:hypothetical protein